MNKSKKSKFIIILLIIAILSAAVFSYYAYSKYTSTLTGNGAATVAKWSFDVALKIGDNTVTLEEGPIDLATTQYNNIVDDKIAPGTSGEFDIIIDTSGTEVGLVYDVSMSLANCPRNITFSKKESAETEATVISAGGAENPDTLERTVTFSEYVAVRPTNENGIFTETIYWDWPYQTDEDATEEEKAAYDQRDTEDKEKTVTMNIKVTGTAVLQDPELEDLIEQEGGDPSAANSVQSLAKAGTIKRWDIVNYDPGTLTTASTNLPTGATLNGTIDASEATEWVVLDVNETTGEVKIMPRTYSPTELTLSGMDGYNNAIKALNNVSSIYLNSNYAKNAKSITIEDVNNVESHTPNGYTATSSWNHQYSMDENLNVIDNGEENKDVERTYTSTAETGIYAYKQSNFKAPFWIASRSVCLETDYGDFCVRYGAVSGGVYNINLFTVNSGGSTDMNDASFPVLPVVTLKSGIQMESQDTFYTETETGTAAVVVGPTEYEHHIWTLK